MTNWRVVLLLLFLWLSWQPSQADPPILEHTIVDDGWAQIDLGFTFPLYDKTFITSFMFANGVVGFISPTEIQGTGIQNDGLCCNAYDFDNVAYADMGATYGGNYGGVRFDYLVAPWHTDLIDIGAGVFKTQGDSTFQSYFWENISEYYDVNDLNTFSTTLYPLGNVSFSYQKLDIQSHKVSVFVSGDLSAGAYEQFFYNDPTNGGVFWTSGDSTPVEIEADESICDVAPDASLVCLWYPESYASAYFDQQCSLDGLYDTGCSNYETAYFDNQCVLDPLYSPACTGWYYVEEETTENEEYGVPEEEYEEYEVFEPETTFEEFEIFDFSDSFDVTDTFASVNMTELEEYDVSFEDIMIEFEQEIEEQMETFFAEMDIEMPEFDMPDLEEFEEIDFEMPSMEDFEEMPEMEEMTEMEFEDFPEPEMEEPIEEVLDEPMEELEETVEEPTQEPETETEPIEEETNEEEVLNEESVESEEETEEESERVEDEEIDEAVEEEEEVDEESSEEESEESEDEPAEESTEEEEVDEPEPEPEDKEEVMVAKVEPKKMTAKEKQKAREKKMREIITNKLKNLAVAMGEASSLQAQKELQNIILALLNYNQGFSSYNLSLSDGNFYESRIIYPIRLPDSLRGRRIGLASELLHKQLVDIQWSEDYGRRQ